MPDYLVTTKLTLISTEGEIRKETAQVESISRAKNEAQAIRHIIADTVTIDRATLDDAIRVGKIETAVGTLAGE